MALQQRELDLKYLLLLSAVNFTLYPQPASSSSVFFFFSLTRRHVESSLCCFHLTAAASAAAATSTARLGHGGASLALPTGGSGCWVCAGGQQVSGHHPPQ